MILDIFALIVFGIIIAFVIALVVKLGPLPGKIASTRGHPQADAVRVLGWIGVITLGLAWPAALIWAYYRPEAQSANVTDRITALEKQVADLKSQEVNS